jgi:hypothetical protein
MISTNFFPNDPVPPVTSIDSRDQLIISYAFKNSLSGYALSFAPWTSARSAAASAIPKARMFCSMRSSGDRL